MAGSNSRHILCLRPDVREKCIQLSFPWKKTAIRSRQMVFSGLVCDKRISLMFFHSPTMDHHFSYSLGIIVAYLKKMIPDLSRSADIKFVSTKEELDQSYLADGINILFASNFIWTLEVNMEICESAKKQYPDLIVVNGGPSSPVNSVLCEEFLREHKFVDYVVRGEGEAATVDLVRYLCYNDGNLSEIYSISYLRDGEYVHNEDNKVYLDVNSFPSPYLENIFDDELVCGAVSACIETNRGCPYNCSYCSWDAASRNKFSFFDMDRIKKEFEWVAKHKIQSVFMSDSNFGMFPRDEQIAKMISEITIKYGYPKNIVVNYAKNCRERIARMLEWFARANIVYTSSIAIQTLDKNTLKAVNRHNMKQSHYEKLAEHFVKRGLFLSVHLMLGLPGATVESFKNDLRYYFDKNYYIELFKTLVLPNSQMATPEYREKYGIETDEEGAVSATSTMCRNEMSLMSDLAVVYHGVRGLGFLRYAVLWCQYDKGIDAIDLLHNLTRYIKDCDKYPNLSLLLDRKILEKYYYFVGTHSEMRENFRKNSSWDMMFEEFYLWLKEQYGITMSRSVMITLLIASTKLMPNIDTAYPCDVNLPHDIAAWYKDNREGRRKPLHSYSPGSLSIVDQCGIAKNGVGPRSIYNRKIQWELNSELFELRKSIPTTALEPVASKPLPETVQPVQSVQAEVAI